MGAGAPAVAKTGFNVYFDATKGNNTSFYNTGVTAKLSFDFKVNPSDPSTYLLDLGISNTSPASGKSSGTLVGFAFNEPLKSDNKSEAISLLGYNPLVSGYERVFGGINNPTSTQRSRGVRFVEGNTRTLTGNSLAPYEPFAPFDFCARVSSSSGCHGGSGDEGIGGQKSVQVQFTLKSNDPNIATADQVAERFFNLFNQYTPTGNNWKDAQIALRFQDVNTGLDRKGKPVMSKDGDKVTGFAKWRVIDEGPVDQVPGPLPVAGGIVAFGWSRRLRRRINSIAAVRASAL
ncbi:hypothetical protein [Cyanobium sp. Copco_Reservoir_LC18]|uniref:hypothetical protein n=1 Tax=Cyanobium sp. Copco_Reservoir_LC18 TaxID=1328305 RepID=UPI0013578598|nr:hypothetical protein [Cyanobium sp. Copco_Reservoir_LC18]